jgi:hypothetical protein
VFQWGGRVQIGSHTIEFFDGFEICQGGPEACRATLNGSVIEGKKFDPSPLAYKGTILLPMRKNTFFKSGYVLVQIDPETRAIKALSKIHGYMKLRCIEEQQVEFWTNAWEGEIAILPLP